MCMFCKKHWNLNLLSSCFSSTWLNQTFFKEIQRKRLIDQETSKLPLTSEYIEQLKHAKLLYEQRQRELDNARTLLQEAEDAYRQIQGSTDTNFQTGFPTDSTTNSSLKSHSSNTFYMPCVINECRGYLTSRNACCTLCRVKVCRDCHKPLSKPILQEQHMNNEGTNENDETSTTEEDTQQEHEPHVCNPDDVASVKLIAKETKPCPSCHTSIFRISGCDQMFCVKCNTPFCWRTGKIEKGQIHNPHYFEYLQKNQVQPNEHPQNERCGGNNRGENQDVTLYDLHNKLGDVRRIPRHFQQFEQPITFKKGDFTGFKKQIGQPSCFQKDLQAANVLLKDWNALTRVLESWIRISWHITQPEYTRLQLQTEDELNERLFKWRIAYLQQKITKEQHADNLVRLEKNQRFMVEYEQLKQSLHLVLQTTLRNIMGLIRTYNPMREPEASSVGQYLQQGHTFVEYYNQELQKLCKLFGYSKCIFIIINSVGVMTST